MIYHLSKVLAHARHDDEGMRFLWTSLATAKTLTGSSCYHQLSSYSPHGVTATGQHPRHFAVVLRTTSHFCPLFTVFSLSSYTTWSFILSIMSLRFWDAWNALSYKTLCVINIFFSACFRFPKAHTWIPESHVGWRVALLPNGLPGKLCQMNKTGGRRRLHCGMVQQGFGHY